MVKKKKKLSHLQNPRHQNSLCVIDNATSVQLKALIKTTHYSILLFLYTPFIQQNTKMQKDDENRHIFDN